MCVGSARSACVSLACQCDLGREQDGGIGSPDMVGAGTLRACFRSNLVEKGSFRGSILATFQHHDENKVGR